MEQVGESNAFFEPIECDTLSVELRGDFEHGFPVTE